MDAMDKICDGCAHMMSSCDCSYCDECNEKEHDCVCLRCESCSNKEHYCVCEEEEEEEDEWHIPEGTDCEYCDSLATNYVQDIAVCDDHFDSAYPID